MDLSELSKAMHAAFAKMNGRQESDREEIRVLRDDLTALVQKMAMRPGGGSYGAGDPGELANLISTSDGFKALTKGATPSFSMEIPSRLLSKNTIVNQVGTGQTLVPADRGPAYIVASPEQRLTVRSLFRQIPVSSNLIERAAEATFTNAAAPQGGDSSPTGSGEGSLKPQSDMTFTLQQTPVVQLAHYIVASRQILSDAPLLQAHLEGRLLYGLNLEEESEFLTGDGTAGTVNGINNQASAFTGGVTNATRLDTLARGANQLSVALYEPSGFILHPIDWLNCQLEKDSNGRYVLGDPAAMMQPRLWTLPVISTPSQTLGRFTVVDAARFGWIADRETATVRISENVNDAFIRNLVHVLCEKRTTLVTELAGAAVYGNLLSAG